MLKVITATGHTLNDLRDYVDKGNVLSMTPHAGNRRLNELMLPSIGGTPKTVFFNQVVRDILDFPDQLILDGNRQQLCDSKTPIVTPYASFGSDIKVDELSARFDLGQVRTLPHLIYKSLSKVQGDFFCFADEELFLCDLDFSKRFLETLIRYNFDGCRVNIFNRSITSEGVMTIDDNIPQNNDTIPTFFDYRTRIFQAIREGEVVDFPGIQLHNMVSVLAEIVKPLYLRSQNSDFVGEIDRPVLVLSGPSMYKYATDKYNLMFLTQAYEVVASEFDLPSNIVCEMVPFSELEFMQPKLNEQFHCLLPELVSAYKYLRSEQSLLRDRGLSTEARKDLILRVNGLRVDLNALKKRVKESVTVEFFTQYDAILNPDQPLEFPEYMMDLTIEDFKKFKLNNF